VVGVVGHKHLQGIEKYWNTLEQRMNELGLTREDMP
jgi:hypothetical protein